MRRWSLLKYLHVSYHHACAFITFLNIWKIVIINHFNALNLLIVSSVSFVSLFLLIGFSLPYGLYFSGFFACLTLFWGGCQIL